MTLKELYQTVGGDYDLATKVLRMDKLIDKYIRKLPGSTVFSDFARAGESMDAAALFDSAHAIKGVCSNLGLVGLARIASDISEEFRPGKERKLSDEEVSGLIKGLTDMYDMTVKAISVYCEG